MSRRWLHALRELFTQDQRDADVARELQAHLDEDAAERVADGVRPDEARFAARRALGNVTAIRERTRDAWTWGRVTLVLRDLVTSPRQDLRFALRAFRKQPGFTAAAVLALALGIGATTTIYSVIQAVLIDPYPMYREVDRIVGPSVRDLASARPGGRTLMQLEELLDYREQATTLSETIAGHRGADVLWSTGQGTEQWTGGLTSGNTFSFMGVDAVVGRTLTLDDEKPGAAPVFVISHKLWASRFGLDPSVVNRVFTLNGVPTTLVGVMPPRVAKLGTEVWLPLRLDRADPAHQNRFFRLQGRLKPGVTVAEAEAEFNAIARRIASKYPKLYPEKFTIKLETLIDAIVGQFRTTLYTMAAAVALLLLIACTNVANMLLSRAAGREQEMAVRASLGASRTRLVRQLLVESLLLALAGAAIGWLIAAGGVAVLAQSMPDGMIPREAEIRLNPTVLLFSLGVAAATAIVFGLVPALQTAKRELTPGLRDAGKGTGGGFRRARLSHGLVVGEIALALVLLTSAGLLMRSFVKLQSADLGFDPETLLFVRVPNGDSLRTVEQQQAFLGAALTRIRALPGVAAATASIGVPPFGGYGDSFEIPGAPAERKRQARIDPVRDGYFDTVGGRLLRGRLLTADDVTGRRPVAVINARLAEQHFPGVDPIGRTLTLVVSRGGNERWTIVGVVSDVRNQGVLEPAESGIFVPLSALAAPFGQVIIVRTAVPPNTLIPSVKRELWAVNPGVAISEAVPISEVLQRFQYAQPRLGLIVFGAFAAVGLVLVVFGVASVVAYTVARQRREIGIRVAIGASRGDVLRLTFGMGLRWLVYGVGIGVAASLAATRALASQLIDVSPTDPLTMALVVAVIAVTGLVASYLPARRALRIDPISVLRAE
jgi:putative ABC transport system permease protein